MGRVCTNNWMLATLAGFTMDCDCFGNHPGEMVWKVDSTAGTWTLLTPIGPGNVPSARTQWSRSAGTPASTFPGSLDVVDTWTFHPKPATSGLSVGLARGGVSAGDATF